MAQTNTKDAQAARADRLLSAGMRRIREGKAPTKVQLPFVQQWLLSQDAEVKAIKKLAQDAQIGEEIANEHWQRIAISTNTIFEVLREFGIALYGNGDDNHEWQCEIGEVKGGLRKLCGRTASGAGMAHGAREGGIMMISVGNKTLPEDIILNARPLEDGNFIVSYNYDGEERAETTFNPFDREDVRNLLNHRPELEIRCLCSGYASIECKIGKCAPSTWWCARCYEDHLLPEDERGQS